VALPAFARRCGAAQQSIDISCRSGPQQQTCSSGFVAVGHAGTGIVQLHRPCSAYANK